MKEKEIKVLEKVKLNWEKKNISKYMSPNLEKFSLRRIDELQEIIIHILNIPLHLKKSQWRRTRKGDVGENLGVRETKRAAELKLHIKDLKMYPVNHSKVSCNSLF